MDVGLHTLQNLRAVIEVVVVLLLIWTNLREIRELITDIFGIWEKQEYRIKSTIIKDIIYIDKTQRAKVRQLRPYKRIKDWDLDIVPRVLDNRQRITNGTKVVTSHYSVPGRSTIHKHSKMFHISLDTTEVFSPHSDHTLFLAYTFEEGLKGYQVSPCFVARRPASTETFTYEAHILDKNYHIRKDGDGKPKLNVFAVDDNGKREIENKDVWGDREDFEDGYKDTDWFRVTIHKPPLNCDIMIQWEWEPFPQPDVLPIQLVQPVYQIQPPQEAHTTQQAQNNELSSNP